MEGENESQASNESEIMIDEAWDDLAVAKDYLETINDTLAMLHNKKLDHFDKLGAIKL